MSRAKGIAAAVGIVAITALSGLVAGIVVMVSVYAWIATHVYRAARDELKAALR